MNNTAKLPAFLGLGFLVAAPMFFGCGGGGHSHIRAAHVIESRYPTFGVFREPLYAPPVPTIRRVYNSDYVVPYRYHGYNCGCSGCVNVYRGSCFFPSVRLWLPSWPRLHFPSIQCGLGERSCYYDQVASYRGVRQGYGRGRYRPFYGRFTANYMAPQISCDLKENEALVASQVLPTLTENFEAGLNEQGELQLKRADLILGGELDESDEGPLFRLAGHWQRQIDQKSVAVATEGRGGWRQDSQLELQGLFVSGVKIANDQHCLVSWGAKFTESN